MSKTSYRKGVRLEYELKELLEADGFFVVRSAGSHGPADLVALKDGEILLVQVQNNGHLPKWKEDALKLAAKRAGGWGYFAYKVKGVWHLRQVYPEEHVTGTLETSGRWCQQVPWLDLRKVLRS